VTPDGLCVASTGDAFSAQPSRSASNSLTSALQLAGRYYVRELSTARGDVDIDFVDVEGNPITLCDDDRTWLRSVH